MNKWLDLIRGLVRPILTVAGFVGLLYLTIKLALEYADREIVFGLIGAVGSAVTMMIGFWFNQRARKT